MTIRQNMKEHSTLLAILTASLFLRIYGLASESFWLDEGFSVKIAKLSIVKIVAETTNDAHPPLYYVLLHYWMAWFGTAEFSIRLLSALLGSLTVFVIYKIGVLLYNKQVGILSAFLLGVSVFHIQYSQEGRMYSLLALLASLSMYFLLKICRQNSRHVVAYLLSTTLLLYTHIYGAFVVLAQNVWILINALGDRKQQTMTLKKWWGLQAIVAVLYLPWLEALLHQIAQVQKGFWLPKPNAFSLFAACYEYMNSTLLLALFVVVSMRAFLEARKSAGKSFLSERATFYLLATWLLLPIGAPFIISRLSAPIFLAKYTIPALSAFCLMAAKGISLIQNVYKKLAILGVVAVSSAISLVQYYTITEKEPWREAVRDIEAQALPGDLILFHAGYCQDIFDYYSRRKDIMKDAFALQKIQGNGKSDLLYSAAKSNRRTWVVFSHSACAGEMPAEMLRQAFGAIRQHQQYFSFYKDYFLNRYMANVLMDRLPNLHKKLAQQFPDFFKNATQRNPDIEVYLFVVEEKVSQSF